MKSACQRWQICPPPAQRHQTDAYVTSSSQYLHPLHLARPRFAQSCEAMALPPALAFAAPALSRAPVAVGGRPRPPLSTCHPAGAALPSSRLSRRRGATPPLPPISAVAAGEAASTAAAVPPSSPGRLPTNTLGNLYVHDSCINCDVCRAMAPATFDAARGQSRVHTQPAVGTGAHTAALRALISCPTGSIRMEDTAAGSAAGGVRAAAQTLPEELTAAGAPGVFRNGYTSPHSFGATNYTVVGSAGGEEGGSAPSVSYMVDSPRYSPVLADRLRKLVASTGAPPITYLFLTHKDDVADHKRWAAALGVRRVIHEADVTASQGTGACEEILTGAGPWTLPGCGVRVLWTPGHSRGSLCFLDLAKGVLFSGDHLALTVTPDGGRALGGFRRYTKHSWEVQMGSVAALGGEPWTVLLPGHARLWTARGAAERERVVAAAVERMSAEL